jgi:hypothetical protein
LGGGGFNLDLKGKYKHRFATFFFPYPPFSFLGGDVPLAPSFGVYFYLLALLHVFIIMFLTSMTIIS